MQAQVHYGEIVRARLRAGARRGYRIAYATKYVDLIREITLELQVILGRRFDGTVLRRIDRGAIARGTGGCRDRRQVAGTHVAHLRARLFQTRERRLEVLVGARDLPFQRIELAVPIDTPPRTTRLGVRRLCRLPVAGFLVRVRRRRGRQPHVYRRERGSGQRTGSTQGKYQQLWFHDLPLPPGVERWADCGGCGCATRRSAPVVIESGGLTMTSSPAATAESTSSDGA